MRLFNNIQGGGGEEISSSSYIQTILPNIFVTMLQLPSQIITNCYHLANPPPSRHNVIYEQSLFGYFENVFGISIKKVKRVIMLTKIDWGHILLIDLFFWIFKNVFWNQHKNY